MRRIKQDSVSDLYYQYSEGITNKYMTFVVWSQGKRDRWVESICISKLPQRVFLTTDFKC